LDSSGDQFLVFQVSKNLVRVKKSIKNWLKIYNAHNKRKLCEKVENIMDLNRILGEGSMYKTQIGLLKDLEATKHSLLELEDKSWRLRIQTLWLKVVDNNSKFFHQYTNFYKSLNMI
jgi:hypothetical protein